MPTSDPVWVRRVDQPSPFAHSFRPVKTVFASLLLLLSAGLVLRAQTAAPAKKPFELYAEFVNDTRVELSDGAVWMMDKGDCFPIYMFKDQQTKLVLKIASTTFQVDAKNV